MQRQKYVFVYHKYRTRFIEKNWHNDVKRDCSIDFSKYRKMKKSIEKSITSNSKVFLQQLIIVSLCDKKKNDFSDAIVWPK